MNVDQLIALLRAAEQDATAPILLLRHAARESMREASIDAALGTPLTDEGRRQARALGARLRGGRPLRLRHSPVARCAETAALIAEAAGPAAVVLGSDDRLGAPYLRDPQGAIARFADLGMAGFVAAWVAGRVPPELVEPHDSAARVLLTALLAARAAAPDVLHVHVTHDLTVIALLGLAFPVGEPGFPWPRYLEGCALSGAAPLILRYQDRARSLDPPAEAPRSA